MNELKNIYEIYKSYKQNSLKGINKNIPLFYFQNSFALCQSELESLKTTYQIDNIKLTDEICISLEEVFNDIKLKEELFYRIKENIFIYDEDEINIKDYTLIWNISGFDNLELLKDKPTKSDKISCEMVNKNGKKVQNVLFESTNSSEYITIEKNLFIQHTKNGISKPYKDIKNNFLNIKAVQCENNLWGFIETYLKSCV